MNSMLNGECLNWTELDNYKSAILEKSERYAKWTIPNVFPSDNIVEGEVLSTQLDSIGAEALNNLTNKLMIALFSPTVPFFRIELSLEKKKKYLNELNLKNETELESILSNIEKETVKLLAKKGLREAVFELLQLLIVTGNALIYYPDDGDIEVFSIRDYCVKRGAGGKIISIIIKDDRLYSSLSERTKSVIGEGGRLYDDNDSVSYFIKCVRGEDGKFHVTHWVEDVLLSNDDTKGIYSEGELPYVPLVWKIARGMNYGTGLVEEYQGDFLGIEVLQEAFVKGLFVAADIKRLVNPGGVTDIDELVDSEFGAYVSGNSSDITTPKVDKGSDFQMVEKGIDGFSRRIARAFLISSLVTRDAERVTAFEIQQQITELETSLGGVFNRLSSTLQYKLASFGLVEYDRSLTVKNGIEPTITTGVDAISRFNEMSVVKSWLNDLAILNGVPESVLSKLDTQSLASYMAYSGGIDASKFVKSQEVIKQEQEEVMNKSQMIEDAQMKREIIKEGV